MGKVLFSQVSVHTQGWVGGGYNIQPNGGTPIWGQRGYSHLRIGEGGIPSEDRGTPIRQDGGTPHLAELGYPPQVGWVPPWLGRMGHPPHQAGWGYPLAPPPPVGQDGVQSSTASTCYVAGDIPLALRYEDFLVYSDITLTNGPCHTLEMHKEDVSEFLPKELSSFRERGTQA